MSDGDPIDRNGLRDRYWERVPLKNLNKREWEALCDGCGRCCLNKLEDEDSGELYFTNVACRLLDHESCKCMDYAHRTDKVRECLVVQPAHAQAYRDMPPTCAYRLLAEQKPLPAWHPLVSGTTESVHQANISVRGKVVSEEFIHPEQLQEHIIFW